MEKLDSIAEEFMEKVPTDLKPIARRLFEYIKSHNAELTYAIKWKRLTFGLNQDFHHWLCAIQHTKKYISLVFHFGGLLDDPSNTFIKGESRFLRKIEYNSIEGIDYSVIQIFINQAAEQLEYFKAHWKELNKED